MSHRVQLFAGHIRVLARFRTLVPDVRAFHLTARTDYGVLPFDAELQDRFHAIYGTGDWSETGGLQLSTRDMAFAAEASRIGPLAYLETDYASNDGLQSAASWIGGAIVVGPLTASAEIQRQRPPSFWPINAALRSIGIKAQGDDDEFAVFGLPQWPSSAVILASALPARL